MMIFSDMERSLPLDKVPVEWLEMQARQVEWAICELEDMLPSRLSEADQKRYERLSHQLIAFQHRLTLERVRRFAVFLDEQLCPSGTPGHRDEQERNRSKQQEL